MSEEAKGVHLRIRVKMDSGQWRRYEAFVMPGDMWTLADKADTTHEEQRIEITVLKA